MINSITAMMNVVEAAKRVDAAQKLTLDKFAIQMRELKRCLRELERYEGKKRSAKKPQPRRSTQRKSQLVATQQPVAAVQEPIAASSANTPEAPAVEANSTNTVSAVATPVETKKVRSAIVPMRKRYKRSKTMKRQSISAKGTHGS